MEELAYLVSVLTSMIENFLKLEKELEREEKIIEDGFQNNIWEKLNYIKDDLLYMEDLIPIIVSRYKSSDDE